MVREFFHNLLIRGLQRLGLSVNQGPEVIEAIHDMAEPAYHQAPDGDFDPSTQDYFETLTMNETLDAIQSETIEEGCIADLDREFPERHMRRELTEDGFRTTEREAFLLTGAGNIVSKDQLVGGGKCSACGAFCDRDNLYICAHCNQVLCRLCVRILLECVYCPTDYELMAWRRDTWQDNVRGQE